MFRPTLGHGNYIYATCPSHALRTSCSPAAWHTSRAALSSTKAPPRGTDRSLLVQDDNRANLCIETGFMRGFLVKTQLAQNCPARMAETRANICSESVPHAVHSYDERASMQESCRGCPSPFIPRFSLEPLLWSQSLQPYSLRRRWYWPQ